MEESIKNIYEGILAGNQDKVSENVNQAIGSELSSQVILNEGLIAAMDRVGFLFETNEFFVPEMLVAARAMKAGLEILRPHLMGEDVDSAGRVLIGTVQGDLHDIGKKLVAIMLEGAGFEVEDLGVDIPPEDFVSGIKDGKVDIVALSALLTTTMTQMEKTLKAIQEAGLRDQVMIIVGGAPVTNDFAREIGADGFAADASAAVKLAKQLVQ